MEDSRQLWEGMNLLRLGGANGAGGISAKLRGKPEEVPSGTFEAIYTVGRDRYSRGSGVEIEVLDWR